MSNMKKLERIPNSTYVMIDSAFRNQNDELEFEGELYSVPSNGLEFCHGSGIIKINLLYHKFQSGDRISLGNVVSKNVVMKNVLMIKKNSSYLRIYHENHGLSFYDRFDPDNAIAFEEIDFVENLPLTFSETETISDTKSYFILKNSNSNTYPNSNSELVVELSNIKGTNSNRNLIGNIPINFLNGKHAVHLIFSLDGSTFRHDPNNYLIKLDKKCSINYADGINYIIDKDNNFTKEISENTIYIRYHSLYGIPLSILNCQDESTRILSVSNIEMNALYVDVGYPAIVDPFNSFYSPEDNIDLDRNLGSNSNINSNFGGGNHCFVRKLSDIRKGFPDPNNYVIQLDRIYSNIESIKIIGSNFPNTVPSITGSNNKLYWKNEEDGDHIYCLEIQPGTYSLSKLAKILEKKFRSTIRIPYNKINNICIDNCLKYDKNGLNKYHNITVNISEECNIISFNSYQEQLLGSDSISVPDTMIRIGLEIDCATNEQDVWLFYLSPKSHPLIQDSFPFTYYNLYRKIETTDFNHFNHFNSTMIDAEIDLETVICLNFYRKEHLTENLINEVKSINSDILLLDFTYDYLNKIVDHKNHFLKVGTIIITDKFIDPLSSRGLFVYQIVKTIDKNNYSVKKYEIGKKYKMVYDDLVLNFSETFIVDKFINNIIPMIHFPSIIKIFHPNHYLSLNTEIEFNISGPINRIPQNILNSKYRINKIVGNDEYIVMLDKYIPLDNINTICQLVSIRYPTRFQLLFNFPDTFGSILGFESCGENSSVTGFKHLVKNIDSYSNPNSNPNSNPIFALNNIPNIKIPTNNYFYICSPELAHIENTKPVSNVFAIGQWMSDHGKISYNCTIPTIKTYCPPLKKLSKISFSFRQKDNQLVDFSGANHSFLLEIIES